MKKKILYAAAGVLTIIMVAGVGASVALSCAVYDKVKDIQSVSAASTSSDKEDDDGDENQDVEYVTIDDIYEILDTSEISDAYISGNSDSLNELDKDTLKMASDIIDEVTTEDMTVYQKEKAIYDWMAKNIQFDSSSLVAVGNNNINCYTPYGVLKGKSAVCVGYATTFKLFMNMLGLDCMVVHDTDLSHSWDLVKLDDDEWYLVDLVFDDTNNGEPIYKYFNCTNSQFEEDHTWNEDDYPIANGTKYSYASQNATDIEELEDIPGEIKKLFDGKGGSKYFRLPEDADLNYLSVMIQGIENRTMFANEDSYIDYSMAIDGDGRYILCMYVIYYDYEEGVPGDEAQYEGLAELLDGLFGPLEYDDYGDEFVNAIE